jgi:hypothetical protein
MMRSPPASGSQQMVHSSIGCCFGLTRLGALLIGAGKKKPRVRKQKAPRVAGD